MPLKSQLVPIITAAIALKQLFSKNPLRLFPIAAALSKYRPGQLTGDLSAGLNVALLAFPQGMAYASIAGLPIEYGIYGSAIATLVAPLFSGSRYIMLGPTNATAVLLFTVLIGIEGDPAFKLAALSIIVVLAGLMLVLGALLGLAGLVQYISRTVVTGYITAAALYIIINQLRKVAGIDFLIPEGTTFFGIVLLTLANLIHIHWPSVFLAVITTGVFIAFGGLARKLGKALPIVAITLALMSLVGFFEAWLFENIPLLQPIWGDGLALLTAVNLSDWSPTLPPLRYDLWTQYFPAAAVIAFLSVLEGLSIGKTLAARQGAKLNVNQEMFSIGMANICCGLGQGMPASGSLTRSQLGFDSGASSPFAQLLVGVITLIGAFILGPYVKYIPEAALGVLVIGIGVSLINRRIIRVVTKTTRSDAIVFAVTFASALLIRLDVAIILGTATSIYLFLRKAAEPELVEFAYDDNTGLHEMTDKEERKDPELSIVHVSGSLFFGAAELFRDQMRRVVEDPNLRIVVLKMRYARHLDASAVLELEELIHYMHENQRTLLISEARPDVVKVFESSGLMEIVKRENFFEDDAVNTTLSTALALKRAKSILGGIMPKISIYAQEKNKQ